MRVVGYSDRLSVAPGEAITFLVSSEEPSFELGFVRLRHGDLNPAGPGFRATEVTAPVAGTYPGRHQALHPGSYARVPGAELALAGDLALAAYVYPTTPGDGRRQVLLGRLADEECAGYALELTPEGALALRLGDGRRVATVSTGAPLHARTWYLVAGSHDAAAGRVRLLQVPLRRWPGDPSAAQHEAPVELDRPADAGVPFLLAAGHVRRASSADAVSGHFNGKLDRPLVARRALSAADLTALAAGALPATVLGDALVAAWDLGAEQATDRLPDRGPAGLDGRTVNYPTRAVTGHNWTGRETRATLAPDQYAAIHFHEDDLEDAGWEPAATLTVPAHWRSGVYAARLTAGDFTDYVPFFVRPARGAPTADIAWLAPTLTYVAYANDHMPTTPGRLESRGWTFEEFVAKGTRYEAAAFRYIVENRLHSLYDYHAGGDGVIYSSRFRPILNHRPGYNKPNLQFKHPHLLNCDLYLVDWLDELAFEYDVITDEDLHEEGLGLLAPYRVVVTGSHPEYWTEAMLDSLDSYLKSGGRFMYLGGNGFYWVTSIDPLKPHVVEVRRGDTGSRAWTSEPGEFYDSSVDELGGLWRLRGRAPQSVVGVGTTAMCGYDRSHPYRRTPASHDPRAAFIFDGVTDDLIGDFGLHMGGAAGWEIDRADVALGTPHHALVVASSFGHSDAYQYVIEESLEMGGTNGGTVHPLVRADMTYYEGPKGGAVFSVGSLSWCGSLSHAGYRNNVSRITANVLRRFADPAALPGDSSGGPR